MKFVSASQPFAIKVVAISAPMRPESFFRIGVAGQTISRLARRGLDASRPGDDVGGFFDLWDPDGLHALGSTVEDGLYGSSSSSNVIWLDVHRRA